MGEDRLNDILDNYYNDYDEDSRLVRDKVHYIEFVTTINYIDKYLKKGNRILEVGAGTGKYSLHYASSGYKVDALELVDANIEVFKSNIKNGMDVSVCQGNAMDLSRYDDDTFDVTLVLGPLYHLFKREEQEKVIREAFRVTKKGGYVYLAFVLFDLPMIESCFINGTMINDYMDNKRIDKEYRAVNNAENIFNLMYFDDVKKIINDVGLGRKLHYVATDGVGRLLKNTVNSMDDEMYKHYVNYHLSVCEREDLIGYSGHILCIFKK